MNNKDLNKKFWMTAFIHLLKVTLTFFVSKGEELNFISNKNATICWTLPTKFMDIFVKRTGKSGHFPWQAVVIDQFSLLINNLF